MSKVRRAFTLIELLVVIAIIAILAAILFPVFAQAKAAAKKTANISNHKQVCTSTLMYQGDADDQYPLAYTLAGVGPKDGITVSNGKAVYTWQNVIQAYAKNWGVLIDPISPWQHNDPVKYVDPFLNYGMLPRAELAGGNRKNWADTWWVPSGSAKFQGLTGLGPDDADGALAASGFIGGTYTATPSMSQTSIASPANTMLAADATFSDMWLLPFMGDIADDAFDYCITWSGVYTNGTTGATTGPWNRYNASDSSWCSPKKTYKANGTMEFTDGHAKCIPIGETFKTAKNASGDTVYVHMWPTEGL